jgi:putative nucleotidyltransferase with HDIG domain
MRSLDRDLHSNPAVVVKEMGGLIAQMATVFLERPEITLRVMGENGGGDDFYHHGLNVSVLCMALVKDLGLTGAQAQVLGMGAFLHDIGLIDIPCAILEKSPGELTDAERELRASHVELGVKRGRELGLAPEILSIIEQHHELADGSGYPLGLELDRITPPARIVALVNFYDNLCNPVDVLQALTPHEALSFMYARRRDKFDALVLRSMIRTLGVYPPGTIVKLSNDAIAMVISVNPHLSRRPWVLLYDAAVPKDDAVMLNLETETGVAISRAIKPSTLPLAAYSYLIPHRRIAYFFDPGPANGGRSE